MEVRNGLLQSIAAVLVNFSRTRKTSKMNSNLWILLGVLALMVTQAAGECKQHSYVGNKFYLMVLETSDTAQRNIQLFVTNHETVNVRVSAETPVYTSDPLLESATTLNIPPRSNDIIELPPSLMTSGTQIENKGVFISSTNGDISLSILNRQPDGCGAYKVIPYDSLGFNYYTLSVWPVNPPNVVNNEIGILATEDSSSITVTVPSGSGITFTYNGITYSDTQELNVVMQRLETLQIQDNQFADMSRIKVSSDKRIAVFTGIQKIDVGIPDTQDDPATDSLAEQMQPIPTYGKLFAIVPFPDITRYYYQILSIVSYTTVTRNGRGTTIRGAPKIISGELVESGAPLFIQSDQPIAVAMVYPSREFENQGGPSIVQVPSIEQYKSEYFFTVPYTSSGSTYTSYVMIAINKADQSGLRMDNLPVDQSVFVDIPNSSPAMVGGAFSIASETHKLSHISGRVFGAYLYGFEANTNCRYVLQAGGCLDDIRQTATTQAATSPVTTSNAISTTQRVTFGTTTPTPFTTTRLATTAAPGTTAPTTPITPPAGVTYKPAENLAGTCTTDYIGTEFFLMFLEMNSDGTPLEVYVGNPGSSTVTVTVEITGQTMTKSIAGGSNEKFEIPSSLMLDGTAIGKNSVHVTSTGGDVTVFGLNTQDAGCGGFKVIPYDSLGYNHYAIAHWPTADVQRRGQIGVVSTKDDTEVVIKLDPSKGTSFVFNGNRYSNTNPEITVFLDRLQVLQVQADTDSDLTGTRIEAKEVVAVFSGMTLTKIGPVSQQDHLVVQAHPTHSWGYNFALMPFPKQDNYRIQVVTSEADTYVNLRTRVFHNAGEILSADLLELSAPKFIQSTNPILVGQYAMSRSNEDEGGPSLVLVPSYEQYKFSYNFNVPQGSSNFPTYVMITIDSGQEGSIRLNTLRITTNWVPIPGSVPAMVGTSFPVGSGLFHVETTNMHPFGAYIWGYEPNTHCGFAYQAGQCLKDIRTTITTSEGTTPGTTVSPSTVDPSASTTPRPVEDNEGTSFVIAFMPKTNPEDGSLEVHISTASVEDITVNVSTPLDQVPAMTPQQVTVSRHNGAVVPVNISVRLDTTGLVFGEVMVEATGDVAVSLLNQGSCGSYLALPQDTFGNVYYVTSWTPMTNDESIALAILCTKLGSVRMQFPGPSTEVVKYGDTTYKGDDTVFLSCGQSVHIILFETKMDLSGTRITAENPVAVLVSDKSLSIGYTTQEDYIVSQFPPVSSYGTRFVVPSSPIKDIEYYIKIVASAAANVTVSDDQSYKMAEGDVQIVDVNDNRPVFIESTAPLLVVKYGKSPQNSRDSGAPFSHIVVSVDHFRTGYPLYASKPATGGEVYMSLVADNQGKAIYDGAELDIAWEAVGTSGYYSGSMIIGVGGHYVEMVGSSAFGLYIYGFEIPGCTFAFPAGMNMEATTTAPTEASSSTTSTVSVSVTSADQTTPQATTPQATTPQATVKSTLTLTNPTTPSLAPTTPGTTPAPVQYNAGKEFSFFVLDGTISLTVSTMETGPLDVVISGLKIADDKFTVSKDAPVTRHYTSTEVADFTTIKVTSSGDVRVDLDNRGSCSSYLVLPNVALGAEYSILVWGPEPSSGDAKAFVAISVLEDATSIVIVPGLNTAETAEISYEGASTPFYDPESHEYEITGDKDTTYYLTANADISGVRVKSNKPVSVFAGNLKTTIGESKDTTMTQFPPASTLGTKYAVPAIPKATGGYVIKITPTLDITTVTLSLEGKEDVVIALHSGQFYSYEVVDNVAVWLTSDQPIQVVQFVKGTSDGETYPVSILIPSYQQYLYEFLVDSPRNDATSVYGIVVISQSDLSGLTMDDAPVDTTGWTAIYGAEYDLVYKAIPIDTESHYFKQTQYANFMVFIYAATLNDCALGNPVSYKLSDYVALQTTTTTGPRVTEPASACIVDDMGDSFTLLFMENENDNVKLEVYPATTLPRDIDISVASPRWTAPAVDQTLTITGGNIDVVDIPSELRITGVNRTTQGIQVTSSSRIGLYAMNTVDGSCDGFLVFPDSVLGTEYLTVSHYPPTDMTQVAISAVQDNTEVQVIFQANSRVSITFTDGIVYKEGSVLKVTMDAFETIQLQDYRDLSGTYIVADKPVAVFSGNILTEVERDFLNGDRSHLVEQMIPLQYWGYEYYLLPFPTIAGSVLKTVASAAASINVTGLDQLTLNSMGDFAWANLPADTPVRVMASEPIMVAQFARSRLMSEVDNDPAMMLIPPIQQYKSWYTFATGRHSQSEFTHYVMVVIDLDDLPGLKIDGFTVDQFSWKTFEDSSPEKVGKAIKISQGVHIVHHQDGKTFGAYVYGSSDDNCAYAYPAGMCFDEVNPYTTPDMTTSEPTTRGPLPTEADCSCINVMSNVQELYSGRYIQETSDMDTPVYKHTECNKFIYQLEENGMKRWAIGPSIGGRRGVIVGEDDSDIDQVTWRSYDEGDAKWVDDPEMTIACDCQLSEVTDCGEIEIIREDAQLVDGSFLLTSQLLNNRPVYQHSSNEDLQLFFYKNTNCSYWALGATQTQESTILYAYDTSLSPEKVTGTFTAYEGDKWAASTANAISIKCLTTQ